MTLHIPHLKLCAGLTLLATAACGDDFTSRSSLDGYRVLGIVANSPEVAPDGKVNISVHDFYDGSRDLEYQWSVCAYSLGEASGFTCADPRLEVELATEPQFELDLSEDGIDLPSMLAELRRLSPSMATDDHFPLWLRLTSGPDCRDCQQETIKRLDVSTSKRPNQNPEIEELVIEGSLRQGTSITLRADVSAPERYEKPPTGETVSEEYLYSWYTSEGETDPPLTFGNTRQTRLQLPARAGEIEVVVAVRDGRGGLAIERRLLDIE